MSTLQSSKKTIAYSPLQIMLAVFIALVGVGYTIAGAKGITDSVCVTSGCELYKGLKLFGVSIWWYGTAGFGLVGLLALVGRIGLARFAAGIGLLIDVGLLALLALTAPCIACLVAGFLLFLLFVVLAYPMGLLGRVLVVAWLLVFSPNVFGTMKSITNPWPIYGSENASVRLYFSPTCPYCLKSANEALVAYPDNLALFPLAKNDEDKPLIAALAQHLHDGNAFPKDLSAYFAKAESEELPQPNNDLRWKLLRNKLSYSSTGAKVVPLLIMIGRPEPITPPHGAEPQRPATPTQPDKPALSRDIPSGMTPATPAMPRPIFPQGPSTFSGCGSDEPCPDVTSPSDQELQ